MQTAPPDKLLNPPRCGGKSKEKSGFRSAERCLRSLSRQTPAIPMKFSEEDMVFISKPDRLLTRAHHHRADADAVGDFVAGINDHPVAFAQALDDFGFEAVGAAGLDGA